MINSVDILQMSVVVVFWMAGTTSKVCHHPATRIIGIVKRSGHGQQHREVLRGHAYLPKQLAGCVLHIVAVTQAIINNHPRDECRLGSMNVCQFLSTCSTYWGVFSADSIDFTTIFNNQYVECEEESFHELVSILGRLQNRIMVSTIYQESSYVLSPH